MIERIVINGYRCFEHLDIRPNPGINLIVGDNESGKSTLLEAVGLALTGRAHGRWAQEELNPFWFNVAAVERFFGKRRAGELSRPPEILVELHFSNAADELQPLRGVHNSIEGADCPGMRMHIAPSEDYADEFAAYLKD